jgi:hypothetical protein
MFKNALNLRHDRQAICARQYDNIFVEYLEFYFR